VEDPVDAPEVELVGGEVDARDLQPPRVLLLDPAVAVKQSMPSTTWHCSTSASARCEPMKPAAPVTT